MRRPLVTIFRLFFVLLITIYIVSWKTVVAEGPYSTNINPATQRYIVKPDFTNLESRITIENTGEDALFRFTNQFDKDKLDVKLFYLSKEQKWSPLLNEPILIEKKASKIIMLSIARKSKTKLDEKDYLIETSTYIQPAYSPLTLSSYLQITPKITTRITLSITKSGYTNINTNVAYFTNLSGPAILSDSAPKVILLIQNLDKYAVDLRGAVKIKNSKGIKSINLKPITIEANNQRFLTNLDNYNGNIEFDNYLAIGKNELAAEISLNNSDTPTLFANYVLWVFPYFVIYPLISSLIVIIIVVFFYNFMKYKK